MDPNETHDERIARWLDGQDVSLDARERSAAEQLRRQEARLAGLLDVRLPPSALAAAREALRRKADGSRRSVLRLVLNIVAAAAAAVLIVAVLWPEQTPALPGEVPTAVLFAEPHRSPSHDELEAVAEQMNQIEAGMIASLPPMPEEGVVKDQLSEEDFDELWLEEWYDDSSG